MKITIVAALGENRVIGLENKLPWKLKADMKRFVELTKGKPVIMGRKTFESIGKPLPNRLNIIITRDTGYEQEGCVVANSIEEALRAAAQNEEAMIIGGASVYRQFLPLADKMRLTLIHESFEGDALFPDFIESEWIKENAEHHQKDSENPYDYTFLTYRRK